MDWNFAFFLNSVALGVGLAMDAFSVSAANGLSCPGMRRRHMARIAGVFAGFQFLMPMIGWFCVHYLVQVFQSFAPFIPWIALLLLAFIGGKMLIEGIRENKKSKTEDVAEEKREASGVMIGFQALLLQGVATSIDALSVGLTIEQYDIIHALVAALIIAVVTFLICVAGIQLGKIFGNRLQGKASILGGVILIAIGLEIFIKGVFFG